MSKKCRAFSKSKLGLEPTDNRKAFYAGWDAALAQQEQEPVADAETWLRNRYGAARGHHAWRELAEAFNAGRFAFTHPPRRETEQEPVAHFGSAYVNENGVHITTVLGPVAIPQDAKLFTHPPRREWQSLTDDELTALGVIHSRYQEEDLETGGWFDFARAIEQALKERNND